MNVKARARRRRLHESRELLTGGLEQRLADGFREQPDQTSRNIPRNPFWRVETELSYRTQKSEREEKRGGALVRGNRSPACSARQCGWAEVLESEKKAL